jgi:hypothetical protein
MALISLVIVNGRQIGQADTKSTRLRKSGCLSRRRRWSALRSAVSDPYTEVGNCNTLLAPQGCCQVP